MATLAKDDRGYYKIRWQADGVRHVFHVGSSRKLSKHQATLIHDCIEDLISASKTGLPLPRATQKWVETRDEKTATQLREKGIYPDHLEPPAPKTTVAKLFKDFLHEHKNQWKPTTRRNRDYAEMAAIRFFTPKRDITTIKHADAIEFRNWLVTPEASPRRRPIAATTANVRLGYVKEVFAYASAHDLVPKSPFQYVKALRETASKNPKKQVPIETVNKLLPHCPDSDWRTLILLARYLGLRVPSEARGLRWRDVDWEAGRITIHVPKLAHKPAKAVREAPLFPEVREALENHWHHVEDKLGHEPPSDSLILDIPHLRHLQGGSLSYYFKQIIIAAGEEPWARPWHSMRATRENDLLRENRFPEAAVYAWIGHDKKTASLNYSLVYAEDFAAAATGAPAPKTIRSKRTSRADMPETEWRDKLVELLKEQNAGTRTVTLADVKAIAPDITPADLSTAVTIAGGGESGVTLRGGKMVFDQKQKDFGHKSVGNQRIDASRRRS